MKRKVVRHGSNTLTVSLPAKWCKQFNVRNGDEVEIDESGNSLSLSAGPLNVEKKIEIFLPPTNKVIMRILGNLYREGFDEVKVNFEDSLVVELIKSQEKLYLGFDIISQKKNFCVIKNVANVLESEFDTMLRKMFLITLSLAEEGYEALKNADFDNLKNIITLEETQNRMYNFCVRIISKRQDKIPDFVFQQIFIERLEEVADEFRDLGKYVVDNRIKVKKEILTFYQEINRLLRLLYEVYYNYNDKHITDIYDLKVILEKKGLRLLEMSGKENVIAHYLTNIVVKTYESASPIVAINYKENVNYCGL